MADCNDALPSYTTTIEVKYGGTNPRAKCDPPTDEEEAAALNEAKKSFLEKALKYCAAGDANCQSDSQRHKTCKATVKFAT